MGNGHTYNDVYYSHLVVHACLQPHKTKTNHTQAMPRTPMFVVHFMFVMGRITACRSYPYQLKGSHMQCQRHYATTLNDWQHLHSNDISLTYEPSPQREPILNTPVCQDRMQECQPTCLDMQNTTENSLCSRIAHMSAHFVCTQPHRVTVTLTYASSSITE